MLLNNLGLLPKELLAQIASHADASSVLSLSQVSRDVREACYDNIIFRDLLINSQACHQIDGLSLDLQALAVRCGQNVSLWARYALADERAWQLITLLGERQASLSVISSWMMALCAIKHPLIGDARLRHALSEESRYWSNSSELAMMCLQPSALACDERSSEIAGNTALARVLYDSHNPSLPYGTQLPSNGCASLSLLAYMTLKLRHALGIRRAIWPFDSAANVPLIEPPTAAQIPLVPLKSSYNLPLPFCAVDEYKKWYADHTYALWQTEFTTGEWCGYYIWMQRIGSNNTPIDPPMSNIHFSGDMDVLGESMVVSAADGTDGHGPFTLVGRLERAYPSNTIRCTLAKTYNSRNGPRWQWTGELTPFGLVGEWRFPHGEYPERPLGSFWLWKKAWTEKS
nr:hypothetical protein CFP56_64585 [Quercus suber]